MIHVYTAEKCHKWMFLLTQWRNDGVDAASRDGGGPVVRGPRQFQSS